MRARVGWNGRGPGQVAGRWPSSLSPQPSGDGGSGRDPWPIEGCESASQGKGPSIHPSMSMGIGGEGGGLSSPCMRTKLAWLPGSPRLESEDKNGLDPVWSCRPSLSSALLYQVVVRGDPARDGWEECGKDQEGPRTGTGLPHPWMLLLSSCFFFSFFTYDTQEAGQVSYLHVRIWAWNLLYCCQGKESSTCGAASRLPMFQEVLTYICTSYLQGSLQ